METKTTHEIFEMYIPQCRPINKQIELKNVEWVRVSDVVSMLEFFDSCNEELLLDTAIKTKLLELKGDL